MIFVEMTLLLLLLLLYSSSSLLLSSSLGYKCYKRSYSINNNIHRHHPRLVRSINPHYNPSIHLFHSSMSLYSLININYDITEQLLPVAPPTREQVRLGDGVRSEGELSCIAL